MKKSIHKRLLLVGLKIVRDLAMGLYENHAGSAPQPVYESVMKLVEDCLDAELKTLQWDVKDEE